MRDDVPPQVVFEILSPSNRTEALVQKRHFYDRYGVEEYYIYDPASANLSGYRRENGRLQAIAEMDGWISPRLKTRFDLSGAELVIYGPDGRPFMTPDRLVSEFEAVEAERTALKWQNAENQKLIADLKAKLAAVKGN